MSLLYPLFFCELTLLCPFFFIARISYFAGPYSYLFFCALIFLRTYFSARLPCCTLVYLAAIFLCALTLLCFKFFFSRALTLLCLNFFSCALPCCKFFS